MKLLLPLVLSVSLLARAASAQPKRIYIGNDDHTDYMWTADADTYNATFVSMLDYYLKLADETQGNPSPYQSRFNADGNFWLWNYERQKSPAEFNRLMARIKDGHISAPLTTLVSTYGAQPAEAVLRGMYYAGRLERRFEVRFPLATAMEDQTLPLGLASLWAGSGAQYSWKGVCGCASQIPNKVLGNRPHEIYWYLGKDGSRVLMKWYSLGPGGIGTYTEAGNPSGAIQYLGSNPNFLARYVDPATQMPYQTSAVFGFGGDSLDRRTGGPSSPGVKAEFGLQGVPGYPETEHFFITAQKESNANRQVIVSNILDFFDDFKAHYGAGLPSESVTYGNEWDLYSASMSETSARVKRAVEKLRAAELLSTLVGLQRPDFLHAREKSRDRAFEDLGLYWEHDWTADGPISRTARAAWQEGLATEIEGYVNSLHADAAMRLSYMIRRPGKETRFWVLNPLGFARSESADFAYSGDENVHVRDLTTGRDVPHQFVRIEGARFLRILAPDVPSAGYKVFEILPGAGTAPTDAAATVSGDGQTVSGDGQTVENAALKLTLEGDGAISSLIDKRGSVELARAIGGLQINDLSPTDNSGTISVENSGPVSVTLRCTSGAGLEHQTWITLYRDSNRVDIRNRITENFANSRYWSFGFNLQNPDVHTEEVGAVVRDKLHSQGGDYADTHARYDHVTLNHFADISDGSNTRGVTLSNADLAFAKLGNSSTTHLDTATPQIHVLAGGQVDGSWLGIRGQNGQTQFLQRFALQPHGPYNQTSAMKFALQHQNPLVTGGVSGTPASAYPEGTYSLLAIDNPDTLLWALKPAEEGIERGVIARVWNMGGAGSYGAGLASGLAWARRVTHVETDIEAVPVVAGQARSAIAPAQMQTLRLMAAPFPTAPLVAANPAQPGQK